MERVQDKGLKHKGELAGTKAHSGLQEGGAARAGYGNVGQTGTGKAFPVEGERAWVKWQGQEEAAVFGERQTVQLDRGVWSNGPEAAGVLRETSWKGVCLVQNSQVLTDPGQLFLPFGPSSL